MDKIILCIVIVIVLICFFNAHKTDENKKENRPFLEKREKETEDFLKQKNFSVTNCCSISNFKKFNDGLINYKSAINTTKYVEQRFMVDDVKQQFALLRYNLGKPVITEQQGDKMWRCFKFNELIDYNLYENGKACLQRNNMPSICGEDGLIIKIKFNNLKEPFLIIDLMEGDIKEQYQNYKEGTEKATNEKLAKQLNIENPYIEAKKNADRIIGMLSYIETSNNI